MSDDNETKKRADALARIREKAKTLPAGRTMMNILSGMLAMVDAEHDAEDPELDEFIVRLVARSPDVATGADHLQFFVTMCKHFIPPAMRRLAAAGRMRVVVVDGEERYLPSLEDMQ